MSNDSIQVPRVKRLVMAGGVLLHVIEVLGPDRLDPDALAAVRAAKVIINEKGRRHAKQVSKMSS